MTASLATSHHKRLGSRGKPEQTRTAILDAALLEFAREGLAGARTDAIARAARVNKALLYYYFGDKEALYAAVVDRVFAGLREKIFAALDRNLPPREAILAYAGAHFDYIASTPIFPRVVGQELLRARRADSPLLRRLVESYFRPVSQRLMGVMRRGIESGEFRPVDPMHFVFSIVAMIVFYFSSVALIRIIRGADPLAPEQIAIRRAAVMDTIRAALFIDRDSSGPNTSESRKGNA